MWLSECFWLCECDACAMPKQGKKEKYTTDSIPPIGIEEIDLRIKTLLFSWQNILKDRQITADIARRKTSQSISQSRRRLRLLDNTAVQIARIWKWNQNI